MPAPTSSTILVHCKHNTGLTFESAATNARLTDWINQAGNGLTVAGVGSSGVKKGLASGQGHAAWDVENGRQSLFFAGIAGQSHLSVNGGISVDRRNLAYVALLRQRNSSLNTTQNRIGGQISVGTVGVDNHYQWNSSAGNTIINGTGSTAQTIVDCMALTTTPTVVGFRTLADGTVKMLFGDRIIPTTGVIAAGVSVGATLGYAHPAVLYSELLYEFAILEDCDTDDKLLEWAEYLHGEFQQEPKRKTLALIGDSIFSGEPYYLTNHTIGEGLADRFPQVHVCSVGVNGAAVTTTTAIDAQRQIAIAGPLLDGTLTSLETEHPWNERIALIWASSNDIDGATLAAANDGTARTSILAAMTARVAECHAEGATRVGIILVIARQWINGNQVAKDALRVNLNADYVSLLAGNDFTIDMVAGNALFDNYDSVLFDADSTHLSLTGRDAAVGIIGDAVESFMAVFPDLTNPVEKYVTVSYGGQNAGLSTVGYTLYDSTGEPITYRRVIPEISTGTYGGLIEVPEGFIGSIVFTKSIADANPFFKQVDYSVVASDFTADDRIALNAAATAAVASANGILADVEIDKTTDPTCYHLVTYIRGTTTEIGRKELRDIDGNKINTDTKIPRQLLEVAVL